MMSDATLNRVSNSYRRGYRAGYAHTYPEIPPEPIALAGLPFAAGDYMGGYTAGANDRKWSDRDDEAARGDPSLGGRLKLDGAA